MFHMVHTRVGYILHLDAVAVITRAMAVHLKINKLKFALQMLLSNKLVQTLNLIKIKLI